MDEEGGIAIMVILNRMSFQEITGMTDLKTQPTNWSA